VYGEKPCLRGLSREALVEFKQVYDTGAKGVAVMKLWRKPFDQEQKAANPRKVLIDKERCKGCGYCVEFCPKEALKMGSELGPKGYNLAKAVDTNKCLGCGLCEIICPEFAIRLEQGEDNKSEAV
jgi:2-oxoglutarate ferredoxin oxidoreductase subunit delta